MAKSVDLPPRSGLPPTDGATCLAPDPIGLLVEEHALQRELCDLLETLADELPGRFDKALAVIAVSILEGSVPRHMRLEEEALFPLLRQRIADDDPLQAALVCLEEEHDRDGATLVELTDALKTAVTDGGVANPDMLGYQLRGYFEGQRRHIAWEDRVVLPAARAVLTPADLVVIQSWVMASAHPRCSRQSVLAIRSARAAGSLCDNCPSSSAASNIVPFSNRSEWSGT